MRNPALSLDKRVKIDPTFPKRKSITSSQNWNILACKNNFFWESVGRLELEIPPFFLLITRKNLQNLGLNCTLIFLEKSGYLNQFWNLGMESGRRWIWGDAHAVKIFESFSERQTSHLERFHGGSVSYRNQCI